MSDPHTITVVGAGTSPIPPDVVVVRLGVDVTDRTPADALERSSAALELVRAALLEAGADRQRLQTSQVSLQPEWEHSGGRPRPSGYTATLGLTVSVQVPERLGETLSAAVAAGGEAVRMEGLSWSVGDPHAAQSAARESAFADARRRAEHYAALAGRSLGAVVQIAEGADSPAAQRHFFGAALSAASMPVDPGVIDIGCAVRVTWELG